MINWALDHPLYVAIFAGLVFAFFWLYTFRDCLKMNVVAVVIVPLISAVVAYTFFRIFAIFEGNTNERAISLFGGVLFMPIYFLLGAKITKRPSRTVCDVLTPCFAAMMLLGRFSCIIGGCCFGKVIPWFTKAKLRWPTRELEILFYAVFLLLFIPRIWKYYKGDAAKTNSKPESRTLFDKLAGKKPFIPGTVYPIFMMAYGIFRFFVEFLREKYTTKVFHLSHLWALISLAAGALFWYELKAEEKLKAKKKKRR